MLKIGLAKEIITPPFGADLMGYFNRRPVDGVLDDICVRAMLIEQDGVKAGFLVFDLCNLLGIDTQIRKALLGAGIEYAGNLIVSAIHTHTGTRTNAVDVPTSMGISIAIEGAIRALKRAERSLAPAEFLYAEGNENPYAFVRRYFMKDGSVATNPTRCNPDIVGPETDFDRHIRVVGIRQGGELTALMVNLANHCDTVGGCKVSADWPGRMEAAIQYALKKDIPVYSMIDASGNINHFKIHENIDQTNYDEAVRIGRGYAELVLDIIKDLKPVPEAKLEISNAKVFIPHRVVSQEQYDAAKKYLEDTKDIPVRDGDITSEGLTNGDVTTLRFFAQRVLDCHDQSTPGDNCTISQIRFGKELAFCSLPGEPFNGISEAIRKASPFKRNIVVELAQTFAPYIPMKECFERGGYEAQPGRNTVAPEGAEILINAVVENFKSNGSFDPNADVMSED